MASTTLTSWALLIWNVLRDRGIDPKVAFARAGLDFTKVGDGQARYKALKIPLLWEAAVDLTGDPELGVAVGKSWCPTTFHALGFAWLASDSLFEGFSRLHRYSHLLNNSLVTGLEPVGAQYRFSITNSEDSSQFHPAGNDAGISSIVKMCRLLAGEEFTPTAVHLIRDHRGPGALEAYLGLTPEYSMQENAILIDRQQADKHLTTGNPVLAQANEQTIEHYMLELEKHNVVAKIIELLPSGNISEEQVAGKLHMNLRTLQRKLKSEDENFRKLLNDTRQRLASGHIKNSHMTLTEIAYLLGFADQANFTRAYKRWTGQSPSAHRKTLYLQTIA